jgi:hypothetical protein
VLFSYRTERGELRRWVEGGRLDDPQAPCEVCREERRVGGERERRTRVSILSRQTVLVPSPLCLPAVNLSTP